MKKLLALLLVCSLLLGLCGCNVFDVTNQILGDNHVDSDAADKDVESGKISLGEVENYVYRNASFGIACSLNEEWVFKTHEEILELNGIVYDALDEDLADRLTDAPILYDMYAIHSENSSTINVNMEKMTASQAANPDLKAILESQFDSLRTGLASVGYSDVSVSYTKVEVDGRQLDGATVHATIESEFRDYDLYETIFCFQRNDYLVNVTVASLLTDTTDDLLSTFTIA